MDLFLLAKASVIGLSIAAPVGPIGLLCMQRTLNGGAQKGLATGLGAAFADAVYGAIGAFGLAALTHFLTALAVPLAVAGGVFLILMGVQLLRHAPGQSVAAGGHSGGTFRAFASALILTLANPMTIVSFVAVFSALSGALQLTQQTALTMISGVFLGSALWWVFLVTTVALIRHRISAHLMVRINQAAGGLLLCFGAWQIQQLIV
ncbi:MAG: LysE family translocator [Amphritea sp.]|nr:LysE family translocator [Amphritea sp.]